MKPITNDEVFNTVPVLEETQPVRFPLWTLEELLGQAMEAARTSHEYELFGVVVHKGTSRESGHYICTLKVCVFF